MESLLPFLQGTCTPYNMPVYPGAQCIIAEALTESDRYPKASFWKPMLGRDWQEGVRLMVLERDLGAAQAACFVFQNMVGTISPDLRGRG